MPNNQQAPHDESMCPAGIVAQIPWLPRRKNATTIPLKQSDFYKHFLAGIHVPDEPTIVDVNELNKLEIIRIFAEVFPFYLPARYHSMDSAQMHKHANSPGSYWTNAIHFVRTCSDLGTIPFYNINKELRSRKPWVKSCSVIGTECKFHDFNEGGPEQCETAAEFLLDPWVISQLLFQPALLHQWCVALLAANLNFAKRLAEICSRGHAKKFNSVVRKLLNLNHNLSKSCNEIFSMFFCFYCFSWKITESLRTKACEHFEELYNQLEEALSILEFVLSDECADILNCIKQESWSSKHSPSSLQWYSQKLVWELSETFPYDGNMYSKSYWLQRHLDRLYSAREAIGKQTHVFAQMSRRDSSDDEESDEEEEKDKAFARQPAEITAIVKSYIDNVILRDKDPLKGLKNGEELFTRLLTVKGSPEYDCMTESTTLWNFYKGRDFRAPRVDRGGVLLDVMTLHADIAAEMALGSIVRLIWEAAEDLDDTYMDAEVSVAKKLSVAEMDALCKPRDRVPWTKEGLLDKLRAACESQAEPDFSVQALQSRLTKRIHLLVLHMHQVNISENFCQLHPEFLLVQYLLPCFVAMLSDVDKDPRMDTDSKVVYERLVHQLIKSYEEEPFIQMEKEYRSPSFHGRADFDKDLKIHLEEVAHILNFIFQGSTTMQTIVKKFLFIGSPCFGEAFPKGDAALADRARDHSEKNLFCPMDSKLQLLKLCCRIKDCAKKLGLAPMKVEPLNFDDLMETFKILTNDALDKIVSVREKAESGSWNELKRRKLDSQIFTDGPTIQQLWGIAVFLAWNNKTSADKFFAAFQGPLFKLDRIQLIVHYFLTDDWWNLKLIFASVTKGPWGQDLSLVPYEVALHDKRFSALRDAFTSTQDRVKMDHPGQVTFCPIKHCRWCGRVNALNFRLCQVCEGDSQYPHPNYFCSEKCEKTAMDQVHTKEHAKFNNERKLLPF